MGRDLAHLQVSAVMIQLDISSLLIVMVSFLEDLNPSKLLRPSSCVTKMKISTIVPLLVSTLLNLSSVTKADNPIVQTLYTADPAPVIYNNRVYMFTGHDEDGSTTYNMRDWRLYSSADMVNWQDHGSPLSYSSFSWSNGNAWAGQVIARNNKFYWYVPIRQNSGAMAIGVAVADSITGPYKDAIGRPLVSNNEIDPTVWIDSDGQAYLYWGNPNLWYVKLNADMISYSSGPTKVSLTTAGFGSRSGNAQRPTTFEEGPWLYKRNSLYYMIYAANCCSEDIRYSTGTSATGPWVGFRRALIADSANLLRRTEV